jgi:hypothetical protein
MSENGKECNGGVHTQSSSEVAKIQKDTTAISVECQKFTGNPKAAIFIQTDILKTLRSEWPNP